jgi:hypothetical protein
MDTTWRKPAEQSVALGDAVACRMADGKVATGVIVESTYWRKLREDGTTDPSPVSVMAVLFDGWRRCEPLGSWSFRSVERLAP